MSSKEIAQAIRDTTFAEPGSGKGARMRRARDRMGNTGAIGQALRRLHDATTSEDLPPDFEALLGALDMADQRGRA